MRRMLLALVAGLLVLPAVYAEEYWIAYEANAYPEECGWEHHYGNWEGIYQGWANRGLASSHNGNSVLTSDSLFDTGVYDYAEIERPGNIDPGPGEVFVAEWRLNVQKCVGGTSYDEEVALAADNGWIVGLGFYEDHIGSPFELELDIPFEPYVFHRYRVESADMVTYRLYLDGLLVHTGTFWQYGVSESYVAWGDSTMGVASLAYWDYFRFGVVSEDALDQMQPAGNATEVFGTLYGPDPVPEPASGWMILGLLVCGGRRRR